MSDKEKFLGEFEQVLLLSVVRLNDNAYGSSIRQLLAETVNRDVTIGALYTTLERLEYKGLVTSKVGEATAERGGRAKKYFKVTAKGKYALRRSKGRTNKSLAGRDVSDTRREVTMQSQPPLLATKCLQWSLPQDIKEAVLGDLQEEFQLKLTSFGAVRANTWYIRQAWFSSFTYLKRTQGGILMFFFSLLIFGGVVLMTFWMGGSLSMYLNLPSAIVVFIPSLLFAFAATSRQAATNGIKTLTNDNVKLSVIEYKTAKRFFHTFGNVALWSGLLGVIIGAVAMASNIEPDRFHVVIGPATAVCLLTILYGVVIKIPCVLAEQRIAFRMDMLNKE